MDFLEDIDDDFIHSEQNYKDIISANTPSLKLPPRDALEYCASVLTTFNGTQFDFEHGAQLFVDESDGTLEKTTAMYCMFAFQRSGVLNCLSEDMPVKDSTFEVKPEFENKTEVLIHIGRLARKKLTEVFGKDVDDTVLKSILPEEAYWGSEPDLF